MNYRTVIIGEQPEVMRKIASVLATHGTSTRIAGSITSLLDDYTSEQIDAVLVGRYLTKKKRQHIEREWRKRNPNVPIIHIQLPVGLLIQELIEAQQFKKSGQEPVASLLSARRNTLHFTTTATCRIRVTIYRYGLLLRTKTITIYDESGVLSGRQIIRIPRAVRGVGGERFIVVTVNAKEKHVVAMK